MHNPTVCLLSSSSLSFASPCVTSSRALVADVLVNTTESLKKIHQLRTFGACLNRGCPSSMCDTLASHVQTEVFHSSPAIWETVCVTFLVNRHTEGGEAINSS